MRARYFASNYFAAGFFGQQQPAFSGYFGAEHFKANYFGAGFYGPVTIISAGDIHASLDVTEAADTLESTATLSVPIIFGGVAVHRPKRIQRPQLEPIHASLYATEIGDTLEAFVTLGFDPVAMDNDLLLVAA